MPPGPDIMSEGGLVGSVENWRFPLPSRGTCHFSRQWPRECGPVFLRNAGNLEFFGERALPSSQAGAFPLECAVPGPQLPGDSGPQYIQLDACSLSRHVPFLRWTRSGGPGLSPAAFLGQFPWVPHSDCSPGARGTYLGGAALPPGRHRRSRCSSSAGAARTRSPPGSAPPGRRPGAARAGAAGSGLRGAAGVRLPPRPAGRGRGHSCPATAGSAPGPQRRLELGAGEKWLGLAEPLRPPVITAEPVSEGYFEG